MLSSAYCHSKLACHVLSYILLVCMDDMFLLILICLYSEDSSHHKGWVLLDTKLKILNLNIVLASKKMLYQIDFTFKLNIQWNTRKRIPENSISVLQNFRLENFFS